MDKKISYVIVGLMVLVFIALVFLSLGVAELRETVGAMIVPVTVSRRRFLPVVGRKGRV